MAKQQLDFDPNDPVDQWMLKFGRWLQKFRLLQLFFWLYVVSAVFSCVVVAVMAAQVPLETLAKSYTFCISFTVSVGLWGILLFYMREHFRFGYATLELFFGFLTAWYTGSTFTNILEDYLKFGAAVYLFVRGLDNWKKAIEEAEENAATGKA